MAAHVPRASGRRAGGAQGRATPPRRRNGPSRKMVDLARDMRSYDYFHSDDPVETAKFVVSDAVAMLWESVLRHDGPCGFRQPECQSGSSAGRRTTGGPAGATVRRRGGDALAVPLARLLATPDMWRTFAESSMEALEAAGRADPKRPRTCTEPSTRPATGVVSGRMISPPGTRCPRSVRGTARGRTAGPARRQPGARRAGTHLPAREDRGVPW